MTPHKIQKGEREGRESNKKKKSWTQINMLIMNERISE